MALFCELEGFWSFVLYLQYLNVFFFFKSAYIYLEVKFKIVAALEVFSSFLSHCFQKLQYKREVKG